MRSCITVCGSELTLSMPPAIESRCWAGCSRPMFDWGCRVSSVKVVHSQGWQVGVVLVEGFFPLYMGFFIGLLEWSGVVTSFPQSKQSKRMKWKAAVSAFMTQLQKSHAFSYILRVRVALIQRAGEDYISRGQSHQGLSWKLATKDPNILTFCNLLYKAITGNFAITHILPLCLAIILLNMAMFSNTYVHMCTPKHSRLSVTQIKVPQIKDLTLWGQPINFIRALDSTSTSQNLSKQSSRLQTKGQEA